MIVKNFDRRSKDHKKSDRDQRSILKDDRDQLIDDQKSDLLIVDHYKRSMIDDHSPPMSRTSQIMVKQKQLNLKQFLKSYLYQMYVLVVWLRVLWRIKEFHARQLRIFSAYFWRLNRTSRIFGILKRNFYNYIDSVTLFVLKCFFLILADIVYVSKSKCTKNFNWFFFARLIDIFSSIEKVISRLRLNYIDVAKISGFKSLKDSGIEKVGAFKTFEASEE